MKLAARTRKLERLLPPVRPKDAPDPDGDRLMTAQALEDAVSLGCERHADPAELGTLTVREWLHRLSIPELERLGEAARQAEIDEAASRAGSKP